MKFSINTNDIKKLLPLLTRISGKDKTTDIGDKILITANTSISFQALNLESGLNSIIPGKIEQPGEVLLTGSVLEGVILGMISKNISFSLKDTNVLISNDTSESLVKKLSYDGFPQIPNMSTKKISVNVQSLLSGFRMTMHAASQSIIHPEYTGLCVLNEKNTLYIVATDGHRLAETRFNSVYKQSFSTIIPLTNISIISKFLDIISNTHIEVDLIIDDSGIHIVTETDHLYSRVINSQFPTYKEIIPKTSDVQVVMLKSDLLSFFKKARIFVSSKYNTITMTTKENNLYLEASNDDVGETKDIVPAEIKGEMSSCTFNYKYINDAISVIEDEKVIFEFNKDYSKPLIISGYNTKIFKSLIMPSFIQ